MTLRSKVVDLVGPYRPHQPFKARSISQIPIVKGEALFADEMIDPFSSETGRSAHNTVDFVALRKKKIRQIRAILAGYAGDECNWHQSSM